MTSLASRLIGRVVASDTIPCHDATLEIAEQIGTLIEQFSDYVASVRSDDMAADSVAELIRLVVEEATTSEGKPEFGWFGWEDEQDEMGLETPDGFTWVTVVADPGTHNEEFATIGHRTCNGKYPLDGPLAREKERRAVWIAEALTAYWRIKPYDHTRAPAQIGA